MPYKPREVLNALLKLGFIEIRQTGSHITLFHPDGRKTLVAMHAKTLPKGTFQKIVKDTLLSTEQFKRYL
jgi:predicted RNA binding protein YcfA (HicA-like mRNA interferase family)